MNPSPDPVARVEAVPAPERPQAFRGPFAIMTILFFMWGFMTVFNDILIPRFKAAFSLDYFHAFLVQFAFFGAYFIARAIRSEAVVSRMQSDFVSAVSHEFRSPLTSIRQLSEILAFGRAPSEERRQVYYETLVREASRLQRLVESLLNFGRMEAGARRYRFEELEVSALVRGGGSNWRDPMRDAASRPTRRRFRWRSATSWTTR
ncbi:MAG: hypothetical protein LAQ30_31585 [Acidobacteriia bacterium]|nr:hypothetical protein [Terriglobia bacterium]